MPPLTIFKENTFFRNVALLAGGTGLAQGLLVLSLPIFTRLYTPESFGILAIFTAITTILSSISSLRYEIAIPLPKSDKVSLCLLRISLISTFIFSIFTFIFIGITSSYIAATLNIQNNINMLWLVPLSVLFGGMYNSLQFWATRTRAFKEIAKTRIEQALSSIFIQVFVGIFSSGPTGLLLGQIISQSMGFGRLLKKTITPIPYYKKRVTNRKILKIAFQYIKYPKFSVLESLANSASTHLPLLVIAALSGANGEIGYILLAMKTMQVPMSLIGNSISQVYFSRAVIEHREGKLRTLTLDVITNLIKAGAAPILAIGCIAPIIFPIIFGENWERAGIIVSWMTPWFLMQFMASPISIALHITNNQKKSMLIQIIGLLIRVGSILLVNYTISSEFLAETYCLSSALFYFIYFDRILHSTKNKWREILSKIKESSIIIVPIVLLGISIRYFFTLFFGS